MFDSPDPALAPRFWQVGALCRAIADSLDARFNPVAVRGEISGFSRASSGHCYFTLKDAQGQIRCAMFRRAAGLLDFTPRDGEMVEVRGRLGVYEPRGDLQLIVEALGKVGQGALFEQFLQRKARLEAQGLFSPERKRPLPTMPRAIGVVTSLGAAALHDVATALRRRVPHIPVVLAPALVQGGGAADDLVRALNGLYQRSDVDVILLVRGGGSLEDLWAFNDENLAHTISRSPVPVVSGVGHETDFTIADFVADLRAPTPTAAAELVSAPRAQWLAELDAQAARLGRALRHRLDAEAQRLDWLTAHLARPSQAVAAERPRLAQLGQRLTHAQALRLERERARLHALAARLPRSLPAPLAAERARLERLAERLPAVLARQLGGADERLQRATLRLSLLDPRLVLERGYAWLQDEGGQPVTRAAQTHAGQPLAAILADGKVDLTVRGRPSR